MIGVGAECLRCEETGFFGVFIVEGQRKRTGLLQFFERSRTRASLRLCDLGIGTLESDGIWW
jgi:hypothetical protein